MFTNKYLMKLFIIFPFFLFVSCTTNYHRLFNLSEENRSYGSYVSINELEFSFRIFADIDKKENRNDSTFNINFFIRPNKIDCDDNKRKLFSNLKIKNISFNYNTSLVILKLKKIISVDSCSTVNSYEPIIIPHSVDTIYCNLSISYFRDKIEILKDTTLTLFRHEFHITDLVGD